MLFSIIIPIYNSEKHILRCIESVKNQSLNDFECLLIDDGSNDNSNAIISKYIENDSRFVLYTKQNMGVSSARNYGLSKANGDFIIFIDSDDWIESTLLETISKYMSDADVIQFDFYKVSSINSKETKKEIHINSNIKLILQGEGAVVWKRAFKHSFIKEISFDENLKGGEDYLFCSEVFIKNPKYIYIDSCLYNYNISNSNSAMNKNSINIFIDQLLATKKVVSLLNEYNLLKLYENDINERFFWCLAEYNNWWLSLRNKKPFYKRFLLKIIKTILKYF